MTAELMPNVQRVMSRLRLGKPSHTLRYSAMISSPPEYRVDAATSSKEGDTRLYVPRTRPASMTFSASTCSTVTSRILSFVSNMLLLSDTYQDIMIYYG